HVIALRDIDLDIEGGEIHIVMGLSGSGKSTLIRLINRLIEPTGGSVHLEGMDIVKLSREPLMELRRRHIAMVFQRFALFPHRNVRDNIAYGLEIQGVDKAPRRKRADEWIERVGLDGYADRAPAELSGGMQQRVGLARALCAGAEILLMDEPFGALDPLIRAEMQDVLLKLQADLKKTILFITHDLNEALLLGSRVAILRDGLLVQDAEPEDIVLNPADAHVAEFVRDINRGRVLTTRALVAAKSQSSLLAVAGPTIPAAMALEDAAALLAREGAPEGVVVLPGDQVLGRLTLAEIVAAMTRPDKT
ncbi:MAG: transporter, nucleotide binding/ATPase protein, partial [Rhodospirillales bacterium]|nr:transporter, nucleotide binding/ATPase protein [Rhodospirillales bacterium]